MEHIKSVKELKKLLATIDKHKKIIADNRDKLREIYDDLETIIESFNNGIDGLENGKIEISAALDSLSEHI